MNTQAAAMPTDRRSALEAAVRYLTGHREYLRYDHALEQGGRPVATGVVEGTARHLVGDRLEITGARWKLPGAKAILKLRGVIGDGDLDRYRTYHLDRGHHRLHQTATRTNTPSPLDHTSHGAEPHPRSPQRPVTPGLVRRIDQFRIRARSAGNSKSHR